MAKRHGCGYPIRSYQIFWGPHATTNPPAGGGTPCPRLTFLRPDRDPWVKSGDRDHRNRITDTSLLPPYYGLNEGQRCWIGGAMGVAPHGVGIVPRLRQAFADGKLGDPAIWDGEPNQQEIDLMNVSQEAWQLLVAMTPQQPAPPAPAPPPVDPPAPPPVDPPVPPPAPDPPLLTRVRALEARVSDLVRWQTEPNTLNQHPDFVWLVEIFQRRVEDIEEWRLAAEADLLSLGRRLAALEAKAHTHQSPGPPPPTPPGPPQPPGPEPDDPDFTWNMGSSWTATSVQPHRLLRVPFRGVAQRIRLRFVVDIPQGTRDRRQQVYSCYVDGSGRYGIMGVLMLDGTGRIFRTGSPGADRPWVDATKHVQSGPATGTFGVVQHWRPGSNALAGLGNFVTDRPGSPLVIAEGLWIDLGYPASSVEHHPEQAEAYSIGWTWSGLSVEVWS